MCVILVLVNNKREKKNLQLSTWFVHLEAIEEVWCPLTTTIVMCFEKQASKHD